METSAWSAGGVASDDVIDTACGDASKASNARCVVAFTIASMGIGVAVDPVASVARYLAPRHAWIAGRGASSLLIGATKLFVTLMV